MRLLVRLAEKVPAGKLVIIFCVKSLQRCYGVEYACFLISNRVTSEQRVERSGDAIDDIELYDKILVHCWIFLF